MSAVADVLNGAADLIEREGWVQNGGGLCAAVAIEREWRKERRVRFSDVLEKLTVHIGRPTADPLGAYLTITTWNDEQERTKAEVVAALRAAAERAS